MKTHDGNPIVPLLAPLAEAMISLGKDPAEGDHLHVGHFLATDHAVVYTLRWENRVVEFFRHQGDEGCAELGAFFHSVLELRARGVGQMPRDLDQKLWTATRARAIGGGP